MTLRTYCICREIHGKSTSFAFKDIEIMDIYKFSCPLCKSESEDQGVHATYIECKNMRTGATSKLSFNQIERVIKKFKFVELINEKRSDEMVGKYVAHRRYVKANNRIIR